MLPYSNTSYLKKHKNRPKTSFTTFTPDLLLYHNMSIYLPDCLVAHLSVCFPVSLFICMSAFLSLGSSLCLPSVLTVHLSVCLPVSLFICMSAFLSLCSSLCLPSCLSVHLYVGLPVSLFIYLTVHPSICPIIHTHVFLLNCQYICHNLLICMSVLLSIYPSVCLSVCLSAFFDK